MGASLAARQLPIPLHPLLAVRPQIVTAVLQAVRPLATGGGAVNGQVRRVAAELPVTSGS
jgi:hypothetical protein